MKQRIGEPKSSTSKLLKVWELSFLNHYPLFSKRANFSYVAGFR